jgi:hypothetical protein
MSSCWGGGCVIWSRFTANFCLRHFPLHTGVWVDLTPRTPPTPPTGLPRLTCQGAMPRVAALRPANARNEPTTSKTVCHCAGCCDTVEVLERRWPGVNKPGGVARVTARHPGECWRECSRFCPEHGDLYRRPGRAWSPMRLSAIGLHGPPAPPACRSSGAGPRYPLLCSPNLWRRQHLHDSLMHAIPGGAGAARRCAASAIDCFTTPYLCAW